LLIFSGSADRGQFEEQIMRNKTCPLPGDRRGQRRGLVIMFAAALSIVVFGMVAFAVDLGYVLLARTKLQLAADSGVLAGIGALATSPDDVETIARQFATANQSVGHGIDSSDVTVTSGDWNRDTGVFTPGSSHPNALKVSVVQNQEPLFFGRVLGKTTFNARAEATASFFPRDMMVVIDCSGSMNDDSEMKSYDTLGQAEVEANLQQIYTELGSPTLGNMQWTPVEITGNVNYVRAQLGLNSVSYPYAGGSWDEFIQHVQSNADINQAGYRNRFGYLTFMQYLLVERPGHDDTPALCTTSSQPMAAVQTGVIELLDYLQDTFTCDRVGLAVYTHPNAPGAILETGLTFDTFAVEQITRQRQARHYTSKTNIGAGIQVARQELEANGRDQSLRMIVLMTDGIANEPGGESGGREFVIEQAQAAADADIRVYTVSVGAWADVELMQQVADISGGIHFNVPGGQTVAEYTDSLRDIFRQIASRRPMQLVE
jgi:hypothetical protein